MHRGKKQESRTLNRCAECGCVISDEHRLCVFCNAKLNYHIKLRENIDVVYLEFLEIDAYSFAFAIENKAEERKIRRFFANGS
ncbi:MAG: hypothetical protein Q4F80_06040 [bacterium]|nr:hypothetical protein [bacterium]